MRSTYIPALLISLALAAPLCAAQQHGNAGSAPHRAPARRGPAPLYVPRSSGPHPARNTAPGFTQRQPQTVPQAAPPQRTAPSTNQPPRQIIRGQGPHNGDWLRDTMRLPANEQQKRLEQDQHFRQLPPQRQEQLRNRLQTFNSMPPQQRQRVLNRMEMMEHLRPEQQRQAVTLFSQFQGMPPERKQMMRQTLRQMRGMPPDARERLLASPEAHARYSPQEIEMLHGFNDIGFVAPE